VAAPCIGSRQGARARSNSTDGQGLRAHVETAIARAGGCRRGDSCSVSSLKAETGKRGRDPCDIEIAKRVRALRLQRGLSQTELGEVLDVTFQQVQKYERGTNRISAGRLYRIAEVLDVPVSFFYEGFEGRGSEPGLHSTDIEFGFLQTSAAMRLIRAYSRITDSGVRQKLLLLTESLAGE